jgi:predicted  nucleic acid-binding Zn-ribbon protein
VVILSTSSLTLYNSHDADKILKLPIFAHLNTKEILELALELVQWSNLHLQEHLSRQSLRSPDRLFQANASTTMRRNQHHLEEREEQYSPPRQYPGTRHGYSGFVHPSMMPEESRRLPFHGEMGSLGDSSHHTASSPGSSSMPPQSPMPAPQPMRSTVLPSPLPLTLPAAPILPSISPPSAAGQTSAQSAHLQDLQHQISVKTLAFQTLQREYDGLLQKLERQKMKCITLEKKFEVSDVEINSLTEEKERLHMQVATLEAQFEDLQQSRDEARRQLVANGAQYMRIMEMANRLQGQSAEDKKKWEAERTELEQRIRLLEEAMVTGTAQASSDADDHPRASPAVSSVMQSHDTATHSASQSETINLLRAEVTRLRSRTHNLETALQTMRRENISIQTAARQLVESGSRLEDVAQGLLGAE